jgi:hypothetical protein
MWRPRINILKTGNKNVAAAVQEITFFSILAISGNFDILPDGEATMVTSSTRIKGGALQFGIPLCCLSRRCGVESELGRSLAPERTKSVENVTAISGHRERMLVLI